MPPAQVTEEEAKSQATVFVKEFFAAVGLTETYVAGKSTEDLFDGLHTLVKESQNPSAALYTDFQESLEKVIRAGIVRRIVGQMTALVSLTDNSPIPKDSDPFDHYSMWYHYFYLLADLSRVLSIAQGRVIELAKTEWRSSGRELIACLRKVHIFRPFKDEIPDHPNVAILRAMAVGLLYPILSETYSVSVPSTSSILNIRAAIPLLAEIRSTIQKPPKTTDIVGLTLSLESAQMFSRCFEKLNIADGFDLPGRGYNASALAGVSYKELVRQSLAATSDSADQMQSRKEQMDVIRNLVGADAGPDLLQVVKEEKIITKSIRLLIEARKTPGHAHITDLYRGPSSSDWYDRTITMWRWLLQRAEKKRDTSLAVEAVNGNLLYLLEWWGFWALDNQLPEVMLATSAIVGILFKKDPATWKVAHNQLRIIHSRMTAAGIRPQLSKVWNTIWAGLAPLGYASKQKFEVCAAIGCVTQNTFAPMLCSRCRGTFYCSQACQKSDWKRHKPQCKAK